MENLIIEFGYSTSPSYKNAVTAAIELPGYYETGEGNNKVVRFQFDIDNEKCIKVLLLIIGWKNTHVLINESVKSLDIITNWFWCYQQRLNSYNGFLYCFLGPAMENLYPLGCHGQTMFGCNEYVIGFQNPSKILSFGKWINSEVWQFNKEAMAEFLKQKYYPLRYCPELNEEYIVSFIDTFPDTVNIKKDKRWLSTNFDGVAPKDKKSAISIFLEIIEKMKAASSIRSTVCKHLQLL